MSLVVKDAIGMAQAQLERAGREDAKLDAELIFRFLFGVDKMGLFKLWGTILDDARFDQYLDLVAVRASGVPLAHITGEQEFMGLSFSVNEKVLIPRQDTETLVEEAMQTVKSLGKKSTAVLDLCCGSGAIGISLAKLCDNVKVTASDVSRDAILIAAKNAKAIGVEKKVSFEEGDLFRPFRKKFNRAVQFDMIVSNPPYIRSHVIPTLQTEVKDHEPLIALDGGADGLAFYRKILLDAPRHLKSGGALLLEIGHDQAGEVLEMAEESGDYADLGIMKDLAGRDRVAVMRTLAKKK